MTNADKPKVSILIPVYNTAKYLDKCMKSVREQTLKEIEIIAVNDASPDNAAEVLAKYVALDPRIKVVTHEKNGGILAARLSGIRAASGEYVICLDADDTLHKDIARAAYAKAKKTGADMVHFQFDVRLGNGRKSPFARKVERDLRPAKESFLGERVFEAAFCERKYRWNICGKMISHEVFSQAAEALPPGYYIMAEDFCFYTLMSFFAKHYEPLSKKGYNYVLNVGVSAYVAADRKGFERSCSVFTALNAVRGFLEKHQVFEKYEASFRLQERLLLGDLADRWYHRVLPSDREYCFEYMLKNYDPLAIIGAMADTFTSPGEMENAVSVLGNANGFFDSIARSASDKCAIVCLDRQSPDALSNQLVKAAADGNFIILNSTAQNAPASVKLRELVQEVQQNQIGTVIIPEANIFADLIWMISAFKTAGVSVAVIPEAGHNSAYRQSIGNACGKKLALRFADGVGVWSSQEAEYFRQCGMRSESLPVFSPTDICVADRTEDIVFCGEAGNITDTLTVMGAVSKLIRQNDFTGKLLILSPGVPEEAERKINEWSRSLDLTGRVLIYDLRTCDAVDKLKTCAAAVICHGDETGARMGFFKGVKVLSYDPASCDMDQLAALLNNTMHSEGDAETAPAPEKSWQKLFDSLKNPPPSAQNSAALLAGEQLVCARASLNYELYSIVPPRDGDTFYSFYAFFDRKLAKFFPAGTRKRHILFAGLRHVMRKIFKRG